MEFEMNGDAELMTGDPAGILSTGDILAVFLLEWTPAGHIPGM